jgi:plasmid stabilization system protein ParE
MRYRIEFSPEANLDINDLHTVIIDDYQSPLTAFRYVQGLVDEIKKLEYHPEIYVIRNDDFYLQFGSAVRRVNYKKMAIIYSVYRTTVFIHRVISGSLIH